MTVNWTDFTPWTALGGGLLIGLAAALFVLFNGRIAGISGIVGGLLRPAQGERGWRIAFLFGLVAAPLVYTLAAPLPAMRRLHQWPWRVRAGARLGPFAGGDAGVHGRRLCDRVHRASSTGLRRTACAS